MLSDRTLHGGNAKIKVVECDILLGVYPCEGSFQVVYAFCEGVDFLMDVSILPWTLGVLNKVLEIGRPLA